ncbi:MAG: TetR/AcrR family transcriptional regulator [Myxococcales bacterium]|nr:TetR/AcrR family transcriptional regulator [Myxococcales bacterium]
MGRPPAGAVAHATPERLLDAAEQAFAVTGYGATRLEDIATAAGIRRPSLLYHYPSKDSLYAAVVHRAFAQLGAVLAEAMALQVSFVERLAAVCNGFTRFLADNPAPARLLVREVVDAEGPGRDILLGEVAPLLDIVERFVRLEGRGLVRPGLPIRAAILQVASGSLLRTASGGLRDPLWGPVDHTWDLARTLFFESEQ